MIRLSCLNPLHFFPDESHSSSSHLLPQRSGRHTSQNPQGQLQHMLGSIARLTWAIHLCSLRRPEKHTRYSSMYTPHGDYKYICIIIHMHFKLPQIHCPYLLFPLVSMHHVRRHLDHSWCTRSDTLVRWGSDTVSNKRILFRPFSTWRFLTNVTEVPGDWNDHRRNFVPESLLITLSTGSARPTSPLQWLRQTQAREEEKETARDTKRVLAGLEGGGGQTDKVWVRQADILPHVL